MGLSTFVAMSPPIRSGPELQYRLWEGLCEHLQGPFSLDFSPFFLIAISVFFV